MPEDVNPKRPASQYYWGDWFKDLALQSCSLPARGLWHEMNCLMHQGDPYGHLTLNGRPMTMQQLSNQCRITPAVCKKLVDELMAAGVPSVDGQSGAIYSRRMVRDEKLRQLRAEIGRANGAKGAEFGIMGAAHGRKGGRPGKLNGGLNGGHDLGQEPGDEPRQNPPKEPPQNPRPSSSSSSSSSPSGGERPSGPPPDKPARQPRGSKRAPDDFIVTADMQAWAEDKAPAVDWRRETEKFRDCEFKTPHSDWKAAWRQWMRRAQEDFEIGRRPPPNGRGGAGDDWKATAI